MTERTTSADSVEQQQRRRRGFLGWLFVGPWILVLAVLVVLLGAWAALWIRYWLRQG